MSNTSRRAAAAVAAATPVLGFWGKHPNLAPELRESERRYERLCELSSDIILDEDLEGRILSINPGGARLCRYSVAELVGRPTLDLVVEDHADRLREQRQRLLAGGGRDIACFELDLRAADGSALAVDVRAGLAFSGERVVGLQVVARNVTERRRLEAQLRQSQKMEAVGRLAGGVAHDFNNILTAIMGFAELALRGLSPSHQSAQDIRQILESGERAAELVNQLLAFSRRQVLQPIVVDPVTAVRSMEPMLRSLIGAQVRLETRFDPNTGRTRVDPNQLAQVLMNLVVNGRDAMPHGGVITIETTSERVAEGVSRGGVPVAAGEYVVLAVSDTGSGMDAWVRAHLFEPFFTTKPEGEGTGLGLATVYGIVKQSCGYIWADSEVGRGTRFEVFLPRVEGAAPKVRRRAPATEEASGGETILLAEDDPDVRCLMVQGLTELGYRVISAGDGPTALSAALAKLDAIDLLVADMVMPGLSGADLAARLHQLRPAVKTLFVSGHAAPPGAQGIDAPILQKPFTPAHLAHVVRAVLEGRWTA